MLGHQVAEHAALPAAGGDDLLRGALLDAVDAGVRLDGSGADLPVDRDRLDVGCRFDQALVQQVAEHQQFGRGAERHQRDQFAAST